jgi:hypothetical protein
MKEVKGVVLPVGNTRTGAVAATPSLPARFRRRPPLCGRISCLPAGVEAQPRAPVWKTARIRERVRPRYLA